MEDPLRQFLIVERGTWGQNKRKKMGKGGRNGDATADLQKQATGEFKKDPASQAFAITRNAFGSRKKRGWGEEKRE